MTISLFRNCGQLVIRSMALGKKYLDLSLKQIFNNASLTIL